MARGDNPASYNNMPKDDKGKPVGKAAYTEGLNKAMAAGGEEGMAVFILDHLARSNDKNNRFRAAKELLAYSAKKKNERSEKMSPIVYEIVGIINNVMQREGVSGVDAIRMLDAANSDR